jgi:hypothetical protein
MFILGTLWVLVRGATAQLPGETTPESPRQETAAAPSSKPAAVPPGANPNDGLENPILADADEQRLTYMDSHVALKYNHDKFEAGSNLDQIRVHGLQAFGPSKRFAAGIELPFLHCNGGATEPSANGFGDMNVEFRAMLGKGETFEHAAGIELILPSASSNVLGMGQTVLRWAWAFPLSLPHTPC